MHGNEKPLTTNRPVPNVPVKPHKTLAHGARIYRTSEGYHGNLDEVEIA